MDAVCIKSGHLYIAEETVPQGYPKNPEDFKNAIEYFEKAYNCFHYTDSLDKNFISMEKKMIARCNEYLTNGVPEIWDGVYTMTSK